jgi:uncharacterized protein YndB with AHSA1/START domain
MAEPSGEPERVGREIALPAPPEVVWASLTRPEDLSAWLGSDVELDLRPGGVLFVRTPGGTMRGLVEALRPDEYLAFRWRPILAGPDGPVPGRGTRVEFFLEPGGARGTTLRVVESLLTAAHSEPGPALRPSQPDPRSGGRIQALTGAPR